MQRMRPEPMKRLSTQTEVVKGRFHGRFFLTANQPLALGFQGLVITIGKIQDFKLEKG